MDNGRKIIYNICDNQRIALCHMQIISFMPRLLVEDFCVPERVLPTKLWPVSRVEPLLRVRTS